MDSVVVCGREATYYDQYTDVHTIEIEGTAVTVGLIETKMPTFNPHASENRFQVLIKVRAFSCNYSDKSRIFAISQKCGEGACYSSIGSEFVGEIIAIGTGVSRLRIGDRVMGNNQFPYSGVSDLLPGIPTDCASKRCWAVHEAKVVKVPLAMPDEVAAAFSVGAQTSYSIIRKLNMKAGKNVLVTAATSNTSLFVINALKQYAVNIYATIAIPSHHSKEKLLQMRVKEVIHVDTSILSLRENRRIEEIVVQTGGFDYVIDPFFDLYLSKTLHTVTMEGKYITSGRGGLYSQLTEKAFLPESEPLQDLMVYASFHNIQLIGNFLGQREDLLRAIDDYNANLLNVTIDSVSQGNSVAAFFERTYNAKDRFGKVVYCYND